MAALNPQPSSSSKRQHQVLVMAGRRRGFDLAEIRRMVGGSITALSAAVCSEWIERFSGRGLANPPGQKKSPYAGRRSNGNLRMITNDHIEQIIRLANQHFREDKDSLCPEDSLCPAARNWLQKNFGVNHPRLLATAQRAAQVITVLKEMHQRRAAQTPSREGKDSLCPVGPKQSSR